MYQRLPDLTEDMLLAEAYYRGQDFAAAIDLIQRILEVCPWASHMRQLRAECYIAQVKYHFSDVLYTINYIFIEIICVLG